MQKTKAIVATLCLIPLFSLCSGCEYIQFSSDDDPQLLVSGHSEGESKRHAGDWAGPLLDMFLGGGSDCQQSAPSWMPEPRHDRHR